MIANLLRKHVKDIEVYRAARDEFSGSAETYLDANENWMDFSGEGKNRYPDPRSEALRAKIEEVMGFKKEHTVLGNGSDELIDMLVRLFCEPGKDSLMIERPTYGEYKVFGGINNVSVIDVPLTAELDLDVDRMKKAIDEYKPKIVFICSPNNPTAQSYELEKISEIASYNQGITVVDEAYADFDPSFKSAYSLIDKNERIVVLRTFSKYWGLASSRIGILISSEEIIDAVNKIKAPYNISLQSQRDGLKALEGAEERRKVLSLILSERDRLNKELEKIAYVKKVYHSDANFILIKVDNADELYSYLMKKGIIVRNRTREPLLENCIRITIGSKEENDKLLEAMRER